MTRAARCCNWQKGAEHHRKECAIKPFFVLTVFTFRGRLRLSDELFGSNFKLNSFCSHWFRTRMCWWLKAWIWQEKKKWARFVLRRLTCLVWNNMSLEGKSSVDFLVVFLTLFFCWCSNQMRCTSPPASICRVFHTNNLSLSTILSSGG